MLVLQPSLPPTGYTRARCSYETLPTCLLHTSWDLYPSPEPFPSLPSHLLQELRNRITALDVLSVVPRPPAAPKTRPKVTLSSFATYSGQPPPPPARFPAPFSISSFATGSSILAYFPPLYYSGYGSPNCLPFQVSEYSFHSFPFLDQDQNVSQSLS